MKALEMSMNTRFPQGTKLAGGIDRKPLTPDRIKVLNRMKREEVKAAKELREWKKFAEDTARSLQKAKEERAAKLLGIAKKSLSKSGASN